MSLYRNSKCVYFKMISINNILLNKSTYDWTSDHNGLSMKKSFKNLLNNYFACRQAITLNNENVLDFLLPL